MPTKSSKTTTTTPARRSPSPASKKPISHAETATKRKRAGAEPVEIPATPTPVQRSEDEILQALANASPADLFQAEKRRRAGLREIADPLAEARREYQALLASEAGTPRGGRPRKVRPKKSDAIEDALEDFHGSDAGADEE